VSDDTTFTPRLGRIKNLGSKTGKSYLKRVLHAVAKAGFHKGKGTRFSGVRSGRGAGAGRVLAGRSSVEGFRQRRVVIKSRFVKIKGRGVKAAQTHLRYIQRDGVTRDGLPGELYGPHDDRVDGTDFLTKSAEDRHQFRLIVAAEDGEQYTDLKPFIRKLMTQMEQDLGTKLEWVAVDHHNTGHPHTHIVLRGRTDRKKDLVIARDYLSSGMRARACEIATFDLGPQTDLELKARRTREVDHERFTGIDAKLIAEQMRHGSVRTLGHGGSDGAARAGRLQKLARLGLAAEVTPGQWRLVDDAEKQLKAMGVKGDIIKTMHHDLKAKRLDRAPVEYAIYDPTDVNARTVSGRVISKGLADEISDRQYVILDATDGYSHYIDIGQVSPDDPVTEGSMIAVSPKQATPRAVDQRIASVAQAFSGRYDAERHQRHDPSVSTEFAETHVRRLEAIRKTARDTGIERSSDGTWTIPNDYLEKAASFERALLRTSPVQIRTLSHLSLERQTSAVGATWLDAELTTDKPTPLRAAGFGKDVTKALSDRQSWLMAQGLAKAEDGRVVYREDLMQELKTREFARVSDEISKNSGMTYAAHGREITGIYRKSLDLASGRVAVIETSTRAFTLVPWRAVLEKNLGQHVFGIARGDSISWTISRTRGLSR
jgi:type IV secretory pathway VirD2 relaxase